MRINIECFPTERRLCTNTDFVSLVSRIIGTEDFKSPNLSIFFNLGQHVVNVSPNSRWDVFNFIKKQKQTRKRAELWVRERSRHPFCPLYSARLFRFPYGYY